MPAIITSSPDTEDLLEALSLYYFPDGSTKYTEVHVKIRKADAEGNDVLRLLSPKDFVVQFTGEQSPIRVDDSFANEASLFDDLRDDAAEADDAK